MRRNKSTKSEESPSSKSMLPITASPEGDVRVTIKCFCMPEEMLNYAAMTAEEALRQFSTRKDVAAYVKKQFDEKYGPLWHCVVGRDFGSYVTHQELGFIVFRIDQWAFLLFSTRH
ncbi:dynein light chain [Echinococcus multilocularis]|uniref:Dynein light chain n=1 Tax=Echinococcus multilocularis TaxID=6211 RepID=A0A068YIJ0_ECHMU|nr:dynein light chain [Echinococcus multilocularis]